MPYAIRYAPAARRWLRKRDKSEQRRLLAAIDDLANDPRPAGCKKLPGHESLWPIRVGPFRVVYRVGDIGAPPAVLVLTIGRRRDVYEEVKRCDGGRCTVRSSRYGALCKFGYTSWPACSSPCYA